jgi:hypothetical protein
MTRLTKRQLSERVLFYSLLLGLTIVLIVWWINFIKYFPQIIF